MKNVLMLILCMCLSSYAYSQSFFIKSGKNFTNYKYESSALGTSVKLNSDSGNYYEIGAAFPLRFNSKFTYEFGVVLNELNSLVGNPAKAVSYKTEYLGLDNAILFSVLKLRHFVLDAKVGFGLHTIIYGKEEIDGVIHDLKIHSEFNGIFFKSLLGIQSKFNASKDIALTMGYDYHYDVLNTNNNNTQSLLIHNGQIKMGIYLTIDKDSKKLIFSENNVDNSGVGLTNRNTMRANPIENAKVDLASRNIATANPVDNTSADLADKNNMTVNSVESSKVDLANSVTNRAHLGNKATSNVVARNSDKVNSVNTNMALVSKNKIKANSIENAKLSKEAGKNITKVGPKDNKSGLLDKNLIDIILNKLNIIEIKINKLERNEKK